MKRTAHMGCLALLVMFFRVTSVCGAGVHAWVLPGGADLNPATSATWKAVGVGIAPAGGIAIGNDRLMVTVKPGESGPILYTRTGKRRLPLTVMQHADTQGKIRWVKVIKSEQDEAVIQFRTGMAEAELRMGIGQTYIEVKPVKNAKYINIGMNARYTLLPDFFGDDVVFDPAKFKAEILTVPAENFLLNLLEGGDGIVMCVWPGSLRLGKETTSAKGPDPRVDLRLSGEGLKRRITGARIEFLNKPVYVGVLEHKNIWCDMDVRSWSGYKPTPIKWKRPFEGKWRANFVVADGKVCRDWHTRSQSFPFRSTTKKGNKRWWIYGGGRADRPILWQESLSFMVYPCWFKNDETYLCLYADLVERKKADRQTKKARKQDKQAPETYPPNIYENVIIYSLDRISETPVSVFTPIDIMRNTLGQGPCEYVLDLESVAPRPDGGTRKLLADATCSLWDLHIYPISRKTIKLKAGEKLATKEHTHLIHAMEDMASFVTAVNDRIREYKKWGRGMTAFCKAKGVSSGKAAPLAADIVARIAVLNRDVDRMRFTGTKNSEGFWLQRIKELINEFNAGNYKNIGQMARIRALGNKQDEMVARCRRYVKGARQTAALADVSDPEVAAFAAAVREKCQMILGNKHPKEGL